MSVRAKFRCESVTKTANSAASVTLSPVTNGSPENDSFYKWTPGGCIALQTINESAADQFVPGKDYYVDFTPADAPLRVVGFADAA